MVKVGADREAVRRKPYSVVLLDEVEKAHPDVLEMFFQVFDKGFDGRCRGREIDFRNTVIILTSNAGSQGIMQACFKHDEEAGGTVMKAFEELPWPTNWPKCCAPRCTNLQACLHWSHEGGALLPLSDDVLIDVIKLVGPHCATCSGQPPGGLEYDDALLELVLSRCTEVDTARAVDHVLNGSLLPEVADAVLARMAEGKALSKIKVGASKTGQFKFKIS